MKTGTCTTCHTPGPIRAKGLCPGCYTRAWRAHRDNMPINMIVPRGPRPTAAKAAATTPRGSVRTAPPLELGIAARGDTVIIDRLRNGQPAHATHPDDRALVIQAVTDGRIGRHVALRALRCNTDALNATLATVAA